MVLLSFQRRALEEARALRPRIRTVQHVGFGVSIRRAAGAWAVGFQNERVTPRVSHGERLGLETTVYTVNDTTRLLELRDLGVTGVFTDDPRRALPRCGQVLRRGPAALRRRRARQPTPSAGTCATTLRPTGSAEARARRHVGDQVAPVTSSGASRARGMSATALRRRARSRPAPRRSPAACSSSASGRIRISTRSPFDRPRASSTRNRSRRARSPGSTVDDRALRAGSSFR